MNQKGFTLAEMLIVIAITVILAVVGLINLNSRKSPTELSNATKQIGALLRQAQSDSMANAQAVPWGVHFANATNTSPFYALFRTSYSTATTQGYYRLPPTVTYITSTLASGATLDVLFTQISGAASVSTTIGIYTLGQSSKSSTIAVSSIGTVTY